LAQNEAKLKKLAKMLLEKEVVEGEDLKKVLGKPLAEVERPRRKSA
jgi:ATP-dependent Zn protease